MVHADLKNSVSNWSDAKNDHCRQAFAHRFELCVRIFEEFSGGSPERARQLRSDPGAGSLFQSDRAHTEPRVVLELSELSYIGSAGLGAFITLRHAVEARHANIVLVGLNPMVYDLFETAGLTKVFTIFETLAEAVT